MKIVPLVVAASLVIAGRGEAASSHLWWDISEQKDATCLYGEITVLATHAPIYYCGANWHPGEPAGGYCGIQHNSPTERRTIFSVWDTSPQLHPTTTHADPQTVANRFGGEGEGGHTHMPWNWQVGQTFRFLVQKRPGAAPGTTEARYFVFDHAQNKWRPSATITSPDGDEKSAASVATIGGGGLASFLENFGGDKDANVAKLALYRLWAGPAVDRLQCLTKAHGDGRWGQLNDCYYLAEGGDDELAAVFAAWKQKAGDPIVGGQGTRLEPISARPLSAALIAALQEAVRANPPPRH